MQTPFRNSFTAVLAAASLVTLLAACSRGGLENHVAAANGEKITWHNELPAAITEAKETGRPVMVDFFATWCPPCKKLDKETYTDARVIAQSRSWVMARIDVDQQKELAQQYQIRSIPTIVVLDPQGNESGRFTGFVGAESMVSLMQKVEASVVGSSDQSKNSETAQLAASQ